MSQKADKKEVVFVEGQCARVDTCPLSAVEAGCTVCIKQLTANPEVSNRLREMGLGEERQIRLISQATSIICQVCNARLGISKQLAETIMVQRIPTSGKPGA